ncbi:hypothetical protein JHD50_05070 [Sulfurimonas sp. MAG313]|nr:hypothetical protein [Sulfurimonas sp. MAG313]MDF1880681.1 hypothetical protein [Sulfurimonas sp. MAG313]
MRRNSNILKDSTMRSGMAMIMAIGFLVIIAGMMATMLNMTAITTAKTEQMYFKEQAQLLAKSGTEFALLAISAHIRNPGGVANSTCVVSTTSQFPANAPYFNIVTNIRYIGLAGAAGTCAANNYISTPFVSGNNIAPESDGMVLIDVYVTSTNALNLSQRIRFHKRTLQKP